ncbi:MAG: PH domain-containing protein [Kangiellaceae bacterium]|jgi:putative membrane protein|nr:PH domain-containing protein [Kangiellaceae bacterium]
MSEDSAVNPTAKKSSSEVTDSSSKWHRLSTLSVIFFIGKTVTNILKDALPGMAPLLVVAYGSENKAFMTTLIVGGIIALTVTSAILQFWFFKYKVEGSRILINDGVFKKNHRIIHFDRIQNINVLQPLYFKPFNLVTLQIETAGAKGNEADLAGLLNTYAESLRIKVLDYQSNISPSLDPSSSVDVAEQAQELASSDINNLMRYGVSSNGIFWFFIIIAPLAGFADDLVGQLIDKEDLYQMSQSLGGGISGGVLLAVAAVAALLFLMFVFSIMGAIFRYYKYRLTLQKDTLRRSSGLLTNYQESLKLPKIQSIVSQSNFIGKWLKVENLTVGQIVSGQGHNNKKSLFVIPARDRRQSLLIQQQLFEDFPEKISTRGISKRYITKTILLKIFLPASLLSAFIFLQTDIIAVLALPLVLSLVLLPLVIKRWRAYRFGMAKGYGRFERGLFGFRHTVFPLFKVQNVEIRQSPVQRRNNLATLKIYLASNRLQIQYIPLADALYWRQTILHQIETVEKNWY